MSYLFTGVGDGRGGSAHPFAQRHGRGRLQQRQVRKTRKELVGQKMFSHLFVHHSCRSWSRPSSMFETPPEPLWKEVRHRHDRESGGFSK